MTISRSISLSVWLSFCLSTYLSTHLPTYLTIYLSIYLSLSYLLLDSTIIRRVVCIQGTAISPAYVSSTRPEILGDRKRCSTFFICFVLQAGWSRISGALDCAIWWFRRRHPDAFLTIVFDEVTFFIPVATDHPDLAAMKRSFYHDLMDLAVYHGHNKHDCKMIFASSSPRVLTLLPFGTLTIHYTVCNSLSCELYFKSYGCTDRCE